MAIGRGSHESQVSSVCAWTKRALKRVTRLPKRIILASVSTARNNPKGVFAADSNFPPMLQLYEKKMRKLRKMKRNLLNANTLYRLYCIMGKPDSSRKFFSLLQSE